MTVASLFSGIGGFELGLSRSGFETELMCDIDPVAQSVLRHQFPNSLLVGDVREIDRLPQTTRILTAGFPCQDLSSVGLKEGISGERSGLIGEVFRIVERSRPEWIVIENVYFMLHLGRGSGIRSIVDALERCGYKWAYRVLDSIGFGLPQRRRRVFVVASLTGSPNDVLLSDSGKLDPVVPTIDRPVGFYWTEGTYATGLAADAIPPLKGGSTIGIPSPPAILLPCGQAGLPHVEDAEALQGFPRGWTAPALLQHRASLRWKLIGNAVPVNVTEWLAQQLRDPGCYDASNDVRLAEGAKWPDAAWGSGGERYISSASHYPQNAVRPSLERHLRNPLKPLSRKAATGFLKRAKKGNLKFPEGFIQKLENHAVDAAN